MVRERVVEQVIASETETPISLMKAPGAVPTLVSEVAELWMGVAREGAREEARDRDRSSAVAGVVSGFGTGGGTQTGRLVHLSDIPPGVQFGSICPEMILQWGK